MVSYRVEKLVKGNLWIRNPEDDTFDSCGVAEFRGSK